MRHETPFPMNNQFMLLDCLKMMWEDGWLDEFSDDHFLIKAIENRLEDFKYSDYYRNNNSILSVGGLDYSVLNDMNSFCENFCLNLSPKLQNLIEKFGKEQIKNFIKNQFSAGKNNYDENKFFQALSEVSILTFYSSFLYILKSEYEPSVGKANGSSSKKNPEASFLCSWQYTYDKKGNIIPGKIYKINIEVKTPSFNKPVNSMLCVPGVLLTEKGKNELIAFCNQYDIETRAPGIGKLATFIKSAIEKFAVPKENEFNLLYINWSQSDFPINGYLEAWSLLTNECNGLLVNKKLQEQYGISTEELNKISAIVVYTEDFESLMFSDFRDVWKRDPRWGVHFRVWIQDEKYREDNGIIFNLIKMNPTENCTIPAFLSTKRTGKIKNQQDIGFIESRIQEIVDRNKLILS